MERLLRNESKRTTASSDGGAQGFSLPFAAALAGIGALRHGRRRSPATVAGIGFRHGGGCSIALSALLGGAAAAFPGSGSAPGRGRSARGRGAAAAPLDARGGFRGFGELRSSQFGVGASDD